MSVETMEVQINNHYDLLESVFKHIEKNWHGPRGKNGRLLEKNSKYLNQTFENFLNEELKKPHYNFNKKNSITIFFCKLPLSDRGVETIVNLINQHNLSDLQSNLQNKMKLQPRFSDHKPEKIAFQSFKGSSIDQIKNFIRELDNEDTPRYIESLNSFSAPVNSPPAAGELDPIDNEVNVNVKGKSDNNWITNQPVAVQKKENHEFDGIIADLLIMLSPDDSMSDLSKKDRKYPQMNQKTALLQELSNDKRTYDEKKSLLAGLIGQVAEILKGNRDQTKTLLSQMEGLISRSHKAENKLHDAEEKTNGIISGMISYEDELKSTITNIKHELEELTNKYNSQNNSTKDLVTKISSLESHNNTLSSENTTIQTLLKDIKDKNASFESKYTVLNNFIQKQSEDLKRAQSTIAEIEKHNKLIEEHNVKLKQQEAASILEISSMKGTIGQLSSKVKQTQAELEEKTVQTERLIVDLDAVRLLLKTELDKLEPLKSEIKQLKKDHELKMKEANNVGKEGVNALTRLHEEKLAVQTKKLNEVLAQIKNLEIQTQSEIEKKDLEITELKNSKQDSNLEKDDLTRKLNEQTSQTTEAQEQLGVLQTKSDILTIQLEKLEQEHSNKIKEIEESNKTALEVLTEQYNQSKESLTQELNEIRSEIKRLTTCSEELNSQLTASQATVTQTQQEVIDLREELNKAQALHTGNLDQIIIALSSAVPGSTKADIQTVSKSLIEMSLDRKNEMISVLRDKMNEELSNLIQNRDETKSLTEENQELENDKLYLIERNKLLETQITDERSELTNAFTIEKNC